MYPYIYQIFIPKSQEVILLFRVIICLFEQSSFLPTMPEDHRMEAKKAIDQAAAETKKAGKRDETYNWYGEYTVLLTTLYRQDV